jgi:hypothetical protein
MKRIVVAALIACISVFPGAFAGQDLAARVPFDFRAGDMHFPPGDYEVGVAGGSLTIRGTAHGRGAVLPVHASEANRNGAPTVSFRAYGDSRFLSTIEVASGERWEIAPSADEAALARATGQPKVVSLKASTVEKK